MIKDKNGYIVLGAGGQIGSALTNRLAARDPDGWILAIDKSIDPIKKVRKNVITLKEKIESLNLMDIVTENFSDVTNIRFIYNAAVSYFSPLQNRSQEELNSTFEVNIQSAIICFKDFLAARKNLKIDQVETSAVFTGSVYGVISPDFRIYGDGDRRNSECYGASKAALIQAVKYFASSFSDTSVRVNAISPGGVFNPTAPQSEEFISKYCDRVPMKRMANTDEIVEVIEFILLDATYINGQNIIVDGGLTAW